jgi:hypothetical protein
MTLLSNDIHSSDERPFRQGRASTLVHLPLKEHRQTLIILQGRVSSAEKFAPALLSSATTKNETFQSAYLYAKRIFLTVLKNQPQFLTKANQKAPTQSLYITCLIFGSSQITLSLETSFRFLDYVRVAFICTDYSSKRYNS